MPIFLRSSTFKSNTFNNYISFFSVLHIPEGRQVLRHCVEAGPIQRDHGGVRRLRRESRVQGEWGIQRYVGDQTQVHIWDESNQLWAH